MLVYNSIITHTYPEYSYNTHTIHTDAKRAIDQGTRLAAVIEEAQTGEIFSAPVGIAHKIAKTLKMV